MGGGGGAWVLCLPIAGATLREDIEDCLDMEEATETLCTWEQRVSRKRT